MAYRKLLRVFHCICFAAFASCGVHPDGVSEVSRYQDDLGNYDFGYKVSNRDGEHFRKEGTDALGRVVGSYGLTEADGRQRVVDYVADKNGFRAHVRSNEPGVVSSNAPSATIEKTVDGIPGSRLDSAASDSSGTAFGDRLKFTDSNVAYARPNLEEPSLRTRPLRPSGYPPGRISTIDRPRQPTRDFQPPGGYYPPLNPYAVRSADGFAPDSSGVQDRVTVPPVRKPITPPYGGYESQFPPVSPSGNEYNRNTGVSISTVNGGLDRPPYSSVPQGPPYTVPLFPNSFPQPQQGGQFGRPLIIPERDNTGSRNPSYVLRTVPIPNGIQAAHVDPSTGQVYDTPEYPLYNQPLGPNNPEYGRSENRSLISNSVQRNTPDSIYRGFDRPQLPPFNTVPDYNSPFRGPPTLPRGNQNLNEGEYNRNRLPLDEADLSRPTARDLDVISRAFGYGNEPLNRRNPVVASPPNRQPFNPFDERPQNRQRFNPVDTTRPPQNRQPFNPIDTFPRTRSPLDPVEAPYNGPTFNDVQRDYTIRYPGFYGITDIDNPNFRNDFRHSSNPSEFNPYFGALPRTPIFQNFPDGYQYPDFDDHRLNNYRGYRSFPENSEEDSEKDGRKEKDI